MHEKFIQKLLLHYYLGYTRQSVEFVPTFSLLEENSKSFLMFNVIMPLLYRAQLDDQLWKNHPIDFIRKEEEFSIGRIEAVPQRFQRSISYKDFVRKDL